MHRAESEGFILPEMMWNSMCQVLPTRESHLISGIQKFYWGSIMYSPSPEFELIHFVFNYTKGRTDMSYPKVSIINHIVDCLVFEVPKQTKMLWTGRTFQRPRDHLPIAKGKG